jgi:hypothetical protein
MLSEAAAFVASYIRLLHLCPAPGAETYTKNHFAGHATAESLLRGIAGSEARILHP